MISVVFESAGTVSHAVIFSTDEIKSSAATTRTITETPSPAQYSILPCPNGCSLSGFFAASLNPKTVILSVC